MPKYTVKGVGEVNLSQKDFIAKGGQGSVFSKGTIAYKIYEDPSKMLPIGKIQELSVLTLPNIIKPEKLLLDKNNTNVGYTMRFVNGLPLCQLFTKSFRQRNNIDNDSILKLTKDLYSLVDFIHQKNILIVDLNELNFLVDNSFNEIYAIDTDSYQTASYPATVIMDSIRDRHCHNNHFTKETDWFSWGILAFQMMIGVHPYKGGHPDFAKYPLDQRMNARMTANVSALHTGSTVPAICQPFDIIPEGLKQWFIAVFDNGKRLAPPKDFVCGKIVVAAIIKQISGSHQFEITEMKSYPTEIISYYSCNGDRLVLTDKTIHLNGQAKSVPSNDVVFSFTQKMSLPFAVYIENGHVKIFDITNQSQLPFNFSASGLMSVDGRIYIQNDTNVLELNFIELGDSVQVTTKQVGKVLDIPGATKVLNGVIIQNMLGRQIASLFPKSGFCYQVGFPELDNYNVVDAKYENNVLVVAAVQRNGHYDRFVFRFSQDFVTYDCRKVENITYTGLNFTVNDAGICILINEEENVEIFSNKKDAGTVKEIDDPAISGDMMLCHDGAKIMFYRGNKIHNFSMRK